MLHNSENGAENKLQQDDLKKKKKKTRKIHTLSRKATTYSCVYFLNYHSFYNSDHSFDRLNMHLGHQLKSLSFLI